MIVNIIKVWLKLLIRMVMAGPASGSSERFCMKMVMTSKFYLNSVLIKIDKNCEKY
jgi:hypothetical protein